MELDLKVASERDGVALHTCNLVDISVELDEASIHAAVVAAAKEMRISGLRPLLTMAGKMMQPIYILGDDGIHVTTATKRVETQVGWIAQFV